MADVITRFKLETTQFDSKLRDTAKQLQSIARQAEKAGKDFSGFDKGSIEAARALGTVASGATNAKDKLRDLVGSFNDAAKAYNSLSEEAKKGEFGKAMAASLQKLQQDIKQTKQELYGLNDTAKKVGDNGALKQLLGGVAGEFGMSASMFTGVGAAVAGVGAAYKAISDNISTAMGFEKSMSQLSSLTGMVGADLEKLKGYAIELGSSTTLSASQVADAFKMIGSQQPQLLESGEALKAVTKNAITLAEAAGIDLATASQTLSTSINQMGGDSNNAERYINVLAAAAQNGAGDIAWLGEAITKSGTTAKAVGTDYEELVANLEQLAKAGFDASTAGTALRSIIMNLEKQANNDFKPSIVGLTQAFENLGKANLSIVGYQEIAGKMFASQAKALADAAGEAKNMTAAITGTNTAEEQAKTNTDNLEGSIKSLSSAWEGFNLHLNSSNGLFRDIVDGLKDIVVWADNVIVKLGEIPNPENIITKSLQEVGSNVDDNGNYIKRPAQKGAAGFDWDSGTWKPGYSGAIYNGATGQKELPEITVAGTKITKTTPKKGGGGNNGPTYAPDSIAAMEAEVSNLTKLWKEAGAAVRDDYAAQLEEAKLRLDTVTGKNSSIAFSPEMAARQLEVAQGKNVVEIPLSSDLAFDEWLSDVKAKLENTKINPIVVPLETTKNNIEGITKAAKTTAQVVGTIGQAFNAIEDPAAKVAAVVAQAIANVALAYSQALAKDVGSKFNIWGFIAASASAMISMATTIASIHQATGYAEGGIVKGNSYSGDNMMFGGDGLYGLNAGELVLTKAQQGSLAQSLQNGGGQTVRVVGKLAGKDLFICAENWAKSAGKGEFVTW